MRNLARSFRCVSDIAEFLRTSLDDLEQDASSIDPVCCGQAVLADDFRDRVTIGDQISDAYRFGIGRATVGFERPRERRCRQAGVFQARQRIRIERNGVRCGDLVAGIS